MGELIGRFHPLVVHLPVGILILAFVMELFGRRKGSGVLDQALPFVLRVAIISAVIACFTGWIMPKEGSFDTEMIGWHFWSAVGMTISILFVYLLKTTKHSNLKKFYFPSFILTMLLLVVTGHYGGSLTHGKGHLTEPLSEKRPKAKSLDSLHVYADIVKPILKQKCFSCHNEGKQKGGLLMSTTAGLMAGGDYGPIVVPGDVEDSKLIKRIHLPLNDDNHMPPEGRKQLSDNEILLLEWWVDEGATFKSHVASLDRSERIESILNTYVRSESAPDISHLENVSDAELEKLQKAGISISRLSAGNPLLIVNLSRDTTLTKRKLGHLKKYRYNIQELDLSSSNADDNMLSVLSGFKNLSKLKLRNTKITTKGIKRLEGLDRLRSLNLHSTIVDDESLEILESLPALNTVYVWDSNISQSGITEFERNNPIIHVQSGVNADVFGDARLKPPILKASRSVFVDTTSLELHLNFKDVGLYYTLDGTLPDSSSLKYESPLMIDRTTVVKAISIKAGWESSEVMEKVLTKVGHKVRTAEVNPSNNKKYQAKGPSSLIDLEMGSTTFGDGSWLGYEGQDMEAILDLGSVKSISNIVMGSLEDTESYIFHPKRIAVSSSQDGKTYEELQSIDIPITDGPKPAEHKSFLLDFMSHSARYIKVNVQGTLKNPSWHAAPGAKNWIFVDEIIVN